MASASSMPGSVSMMSSTGSIGTDSGSSRWMEPFLKQARTVGESLNVSSGLGVRARSHCVAVLCAVMGAWLARSGSLCNERSSAPYGTAGHTLNRPLARRWEAVGALGGRQPTNTKARGSPCIQRKNKAILVLNECLMIVLIHE